MIKPVATLDDILHRGDWCAQLQQAWYEHIPLSEKNGRAHSAIYRAKNLSPPCRKQAIRIRITRCLPGVYSRWQRSPVGGLIWLMLRERHLGGTIILADAHIRYSKPISGKPLMR